MSMVLALDYNKTYASGANYRDSFIMTVLGLRLPITSGGAINPPRASLLPDYFTEYESYDFIGWDGNDALPISSETISASRALNSLLPRDATPDIAPGYNGVIGFEWRGHIRGDEYYLLVEIGPGEKTSVHAVDQNGGASSAVFVSVPKAWPHISAKLTEYAVAYNGR